MSRAGLCAISVVVLLLLCGSPAAADQAEAPPAQESLPRIAAIRFTGNEHLPTSELEGLLKTKKGKPLVAETLRDDVDRIIARYEDAGFMKVKVLATHDPEEGLEGDVLTIAITEGPRFRVRSLVLAGNSVYAQDELRSLVCPEKDGYFSMGAFKAGARNIWAHYGNAGRLTTSVRPEIVRADMATNELDLRYSISEGPPITLAAIEIEHIGQPPTRDELILRELRLEEGSPLTLPMLETAVGRLRKRGWFKAVSYRFRPGATPEQAVLVVVVEEGGTARVSLMASAATYTGVGAALSFVERNFDPTRFPTSLKDVEEWNMFRGGGDRLAITLNPGDKFSTFGLSYQHPYAWGTENTFLLSGQFKIQETTQYDLQQWEVRTGLARRLNEHWNASFGPLIQGTDVSDVANPAVRDYMEAKGFTLGYGAWGRLVYDTTPDVAVPNRGVRVSLGAEPMHADSTFARVSLSATKLFGLYGEGDRAHVLELSGRLGTILGEAPFYERFYCGGPGTVRGFATRGIGPRQAGEPVGGDALAVGRAEYTFPLFKIKDDFLFRGAAFLDAGEAEEEIDELGRVRAGAGLGLRLLIPKLRGTAAGVNLGWPLLKRSGDETQVVSFFIGLNL